MCVCVCVCVVCRVFTFWVTEIQQIANVPFSQPAQLPSGVLYRRRLLRHVCDIRCKDMSDTVVQVCAYDDATGAVSPAMTSFRMSHINQGRIFGVDGTRMVCLHSDNVYTSYACNCV